MEKQKGHALTPAEVRSMFSDSYNFFLEFKDQDMLNLEIQKKINDYCIEFGSRYHGAEPARLIIDAVLRALIDLAGERMEKSS